MFPYNLLVIIPVICFICIRNEKKREAGIIISFFTILFAILALRADMIGIDLENYKFVFRRCGELNWVEMKQFSHNTDIGEYGYFFLNKAVLYFTNNFQYFLMVIALIETIPFCILYKKYSQNMLLAVALFLTIGPFPILFSGLRQAIGLAFVAPAYYYTRNKKPVQFIVVVLFATLFHQSALIILLLYPVYHIKINREWVLIIVPVALFVLVYNKPIFQFLLQFIGEKYRVKFGIEQTGAYSVLILLFLFVIYSFVMVDTRNDAEYIGLRNILLLAFCLQLFVPISTVAMRMNYYFLVMLPIIIPQIAYRSKIKMKQIASFAEIIMCIFFFAYFIRDTYVGADILELYPYLAFWQ